MSTNLVIPTVGSEGHYETLAPFNSKVLPNVRYVCQAVRKLNDYLANNEKPLDTIYLKNGLTQEDYENDLRDGMYIVSLQSGVGQWVYIPARYLVSYPISNGVYYHEVALVANLGSIPTGVDLSPIKAAVSNTLYDYIGVTPSIIETEISATIVLPYEKHQEIQTYRDEHKRIFQSDSERLRLANQQIDRLKYQMQQLEKYIKDKLHLTET